MPLKRKNSKSGFILRRSHSTSAPKTFVVLGAPRGGTSLAAGALRLAGIFMGDDTDPANNEDRAFNFHEGNVSLLTNPEDRARYLERIRQTIDRRNAMHPVWGWKDPLSPLYVADILPDLVNPHFILVTRDLTAMIMRERLETSALPSGSDEDSFCLEKADKAISLYHAALTIIRQSSAPVLFLSYEKSIRNVEDFATQILEFTSGRRRSARGMAKVAEAIALYAREGAVSADLAHRPVPIGRENRGRSYADLAKYPDLPAVYHQCATLINLRHYEQGLALARIVLAEAVSNFDAFPNLKDNPILCTEVEGGMWFMVAVAQLNLGDALASCMALERFQAVANYLKIMGHKSDLMDGVAKEAANLSRLLQRELRR